MMYSIETVVFIYLHV